jgi:hypothetical protein
MSMYDTFGTDEHAERSGVWVDYGSFRVLLARAGGKNKAFEKGLEIATKPFRRAIAAGRMENDRLSEIVRKVFVETCILAWETKQNDSFVKGIEYPRGTIVEPTKATILAALTDLPDLFDDLQAQASSINLFRQEELAEDAGN